jgi:hypothetical protein
MESGTSPIQTIDLPDNTRSFLSQPISPPLGYTVNYYTTDADGSVYYDSGGRRLSQGNVLASPFPDDVEKVCFHSERLWVSRTLAYGGSILWFSDTHNYHLYDAIARYLLIPGKILDMVSLPEGLLVCTDAEIWLCDEQSINSLARYGVVPGRAIARMPDGTVRIHTKRGQCVAMPFKNLTEEKCSLSPGFTCSTAVVEQHGVQKFIVLNDGSGAPYNARF